MATHRASLDAFAGLEKQARRGAAPPGAPGATAEQARADAEAAAAAARRDEDFLRHAVEELAALAPKPDDEETLAGERQLLRAGSALGEAVAQALAELEQGRGAVARAAHGASPDRAQRRQGRGPPRSRAGGARPGAERGDRGAGPARGRARTRWSSTRRGWRRSRSGCSRCAPPPASTVSPCPSWRRSPTSSLPSWPRSTTARPASKRAGGRGEGRARRLSRRRRGAGGGPPQGRGAARQGGRGRAAAAQAREGQVRHRPCARLPEAEWSEAGTDRVQFMVATNPGTPPAPLARIASGGELSRFLLALKVVPGQDRRRRRRSCSTKSIPASAAPPRPLSASGWSGWRRTSRCWWSPIRRRSRRWPTGTWLIRKTTTRSTASTDVAGARRQGPPRGDRPHAVGRRGDRRGARRGRPPAGGG